MPSIKSSYINLGFPDMIRRARGAADATKLGHWRGIDAVIYSAFAVEAFTNDFATMAQKFQPKPNGDTSRIWEELFQAERERKQAVEKYTILFSVLTGKKADKGKAPLQQLTLLIKLRNAIVHHKPDEVFFVSGKQQRDPPITKLIERLRLEGDLIAKNLVLVSDWRIMLDASPPVAVWAVDTARAMIRWVCDAAPESEIKSKWLIPMTGPNSSSYNDLHKT